MTAFGALANPWVAGLGVYEPGRPVDEVARELGFKNADAILKLASNENSLGPSPRASRAMRQAVARMHYYPDGDAFYLRHKLARALGVEPGQIMVGNGSNEIIEFLARVFLHPGANIVMADRAFVVYKLIALAARAEAVMAPMKDYTHDLDAMLRAITPATKLVFIANPNNPTGTMVSNATLARFMARVPGHVVVVLDEAYIELVPPRKQPPALDYVRRGRNVVVLRTFSKTYGLAGLRIGYAVAPPDCIKLIQRVRQPFNVNAMALAAAEAALDDRAFVARTRRMVAAGLRQFEKGFAALGLRYVPSMANFILVEVGRGRELFQALQREGVIVRPMDGYGLPDHVRITVGTVAENRRCLAALAKVLKRRGRVPS